MSLHRRNPYWPYWGFTDMGPPQFPNPLPQRIGLTDEADGSVWYLAFDASSNHIVLTNIIPGGDQHNTVVYGIGDGPTIPTFWGEARLRLNAGHLSFLLPAPPAQAPRQGPPVWARDISSRTAVYYVAGSSTQATPHLAYLLYTVTNPQSAP